MYHASKPACGGNAVALSLRNMAAKPVFTKEQQALIRQAGIRVWETQFKGQKSAQTKMALALGITQQSVSNLFKGTYKPGLRVAQEISILDGRNTLEELIGPYTKHEDAPSTSRAVADETSFSNLIVCVRFFSGTKHWSPWTIAAAKAGFFGPTDFDPPVWVSKLDMLEKALERVRKAA